MDGNKPTNEARRGRTASLRAKVHEVIFEADTATGRFFDIFLIVCVIVSVIAVMLSTVASIEAEYGGFLYQLEWCFTILFTVEYLLRLWSVNRRRRYAFSFFGIVDLLAILPTYLALVVPETQYLLLVRFLRVLRIFRILKLLEYMAGAQLLVTALRASKAKIIVFSTTMLVLVTLVGAVMYLIEGPERGFTSMPRSIYWCIVTITTVGYGDISPQTPLGQAVAGLVMLTGYAIIAVPTGIVTAEIMNEVRRHPPQKNTQICQQCGASGHQDDALHCRRCGYTLHRAEQEKPARRQ